MVVEKQKKDANKYIAEVNKTKLADRLKKAE